MRRLFLISSFLTLFAIGSSAQWKPAGDKIKTDELERTVELCRYK